MHRNGIVCSNFIALLDRKLPVSLSTPSYNTVVYKYDTDWIKISGGSTEVLQWN